MAKSYATLMPTAGRWRAPQRVEKASSCRFRERDPAVYNKGTSYEECHDPARFNGKRRSAAFWSVTTISPDLLAWPDD
jgi:hypothetical protein